MTDEPQQTLTPSPEAQIAGRMPMVIHAQYIKDLSFENPNPAIVLDRKGGKPEMDVNFSIDAEHLESKEHKYLYEVKFGITIKARKDGQAAFIAQLLYGVLVSLDEVSEDQHHPLLFIEAPRFAFPFVRMAVANLTQQGGYMPLLLAPVDFRAMYVQRFGDEIRKSQEDLQKKQSA